MSEQRPAPESGQHLRFLEAVLFAAALTPACTAGDSSSPSTSPIGSVGFQLTRLSVPDGAIWQINREMDFPLTVSTSCGLLLGSTSPWPS